MPLGRFLLRSGRHAEEVNSALVNKRRGWNAYFPMPFRKSARVELVYDGPLPPAASCGAPCPATAMSCTARRATSRNRPATSTLLASGVVVARPGEYIALEAKGKGKFVGWNVTVRAPGKGAPTRTVIRSIRTRSSSSTGKRSRRSSSKGMEDSFGFSWGFPETQSQFPLTGYYPFFKGACGYRFLSRTPSVSRNRSREDRLRQARGPAGRFAKPENRLQMSSTVYWYQTEPHAALTALPPAAGAPRAEDPSWAEQEGRREAKK